MNCMLTGETGAQNKSDSVCTSFGDQLSEESLGVSPAQEKGKKKFKIPGILKKTKDRHKADIPDPPGTFNRCFYTNNIW